MVQNKQDAGVERDSTVSAEVNQFSRASRFPQFMHLCPYSTGSSPEAYYSSLEQLRAPISG